MAATAEEFGELADHSWIRCLDCDPEAADNEPNRRSREVRSGHWVPVKPDALPATRLVITSALLAAEMGMDSRFLLSDEFRRFFSGEVDAVPAMKSWCTPYALSIMGTQYTNNCPFKTGNGYGDGRAISVGEIVTKAGLRWEMQLKGGGQTPFCRGADGRAVLRSSIREFLASEAMHHLGISTTRALSLVVSDKATVQRPWYSGAQSAPDKDDARLASVPPEMRAMLLAMLAQQGRDPDSMVRESCAITCRVAPSFLRVGHLDLFARRAGSKNASDLQKQQLEKIVQHAIDREYPDSCSSGDLLERSLSMMRVFAERLAALTAGWIRVGFCQGNFNADNCLVGGRTMDYGPFGFIDEFDPGFAKWVGSGDHFAFMNQIQAGLANFTTFATSLKPLFPQGDQRVDSLLSSIRESVFKPALLGAFAPKLGLSLECKALPDVVASLQAVLSQLQPDYTIFFRELASLVSMPLGTSEEALVRALSPSFYRVPSESDVAELVGWIRRWLIALGDEGRVVDAAARMKRANPKYVLREWMLADAYRLAAQGDFTVVHELHRLSCSPYDEQPEFECKYYRLAPREALSQPGLAFMT